MIEVLLPAGENLVLVRAPLDDFVEQDINAQVMPPEMFARLSENLAAEGRLEQLPFGVLRPKEKLPDHLTFPLTIEGKVEIMSGHHRLRAARSAGLGTIMALADTRNLSRSAVVAKQLAHNSIFGESDKQTLGRLFAEITDIEHQLESFIQPTEFDSVRQLEPAKVVDISLAIPFRHMTLTFMPSTEASMENIAALVAKVPKDTDIIGVVSHDVYERFRDACRATGRTENIRSLGTIFSRMIEIVEEKLGAGADTPVVAEGTSAPEVEQPVARARRKPRAAGAAQ